jgi:hypothetical protein
MFQLTPQRLLIIRFSNFTQEIILHGQICNIVQQGK